MTILQTPNNNSTERRMRNVAYFRGNVLILKLTHFVCIEIFNFILSSLTAPNGEKNRFLEKLFMTELQIPNNN